MISNLIGIADQLPSKEVATRVRAMAPSSFSSFGDFRALGQAKQLAPEFDVANDPAQPERLV